MSNPEEIQQQIEQTRSELSGDVDRLSEKVSPPRGVGRQVDRAKYRAAGVREKVMGSAEEDSGLRGANDSLTSAADGAKGAGQAMRQQTQGNPLGAGLAAFGLGMVISSLLPASQAEAQLAAQAEEKVKELAEPAKQAGQQLAQDLKPAAQEAVEQVKSTARDAAQDTTEQAKSTAQDVKAPLQQ